MDGETADLNAVLAADVLDQRALARDLDELLFVVAVLVELADVAGRHLVGQGDGDGVVDAGEPDGDVGDESHIGAELVGDLALVNVVGQAVGDEVVGEVVDVVLRAGLGAGARVAGHTEDGGVCRRGRDVLEEGRNTELSGGRVTAGVGDAGGRGDLVALGELGQTVCPGRVEAVVGAEVHNEGLLVAGFLNSVNKRLADTVREGHDPAVNLLPLSHLTDLVGREVLVDDLLLLVTLELLASQFARADMAEVHVGVTVQ